MKKALNPLGLQRRVQFGRRDEIIFDGISRPDHESLLQTRDRTHHLQLDLCRHAGGEAVEIHFAGFQSLRLQEDLMAFLVGELDDLVFDARTITRPDTDNSPSIKRRFFKIGPQQRVKPLVRITDVAGDLRQCTSGRPKREESGFGISTLFLESGIIDGLPVEPGRRAGLQTADAESNLFKILCQQDRR